MGGTATKKAELDAGVFGEEEFANLKKCFRGACNAKSTPRAPPLIMRKKEFEAVFTDIVPRMFAMINSAKDGEITLLQFRDGVAICSGRRRQQAQLRALLQICLGAAESTAIDAVALRAFFITAFHLSIIAETGSVKNAVAMAFDPSRLVQSLLKGRKTVALQDLKEWTADTAPNFPRILGTFVYARCYLLGRAKGSSAVPRLPTSGQVFRWPALTAASVLGREHLFSLALASENLQTSWHLLYDVSHGRSFAQLCHDVEGYEGPTVMVIRDMAGRVFGAYAGSAWESNVSGFHGSANSFLFSVAPHFKVRRPTGFKENYMYLNQNGHSSPHGIGFGGEVRDFRIWVSCDFGTDDTACYERSSGLTYKKGQLRDTASKESFAVDTLEVWGLGGAGALQAQQRAHADTANARNQMRQVNKSLFMDGFTKDFLLSKTFGAHKGPAQLSRDDADDDAEVAEESNRTSKWR